MNFIKVITCSILLIAFGSCNESKMKEELNQLENKAQGLLEDIEALKTEEFKINQIQSQKLIAQLAPFLEDLNKPSVDIVARLANAEKGHRKMKIGPEALSKELNFSIEQLQALNFEIEQDSLSPEKLQKYLDDEKRNLAKLEEFSQSVLIRTEDINKRYQNLIPIARHIVDSLKKVGSINE